MSLLRMLILKISFSFNLSNLADEYLLALDNLYKAVEYEKGKQRREANANNISNGTFQGSQGL